jgi:hypothetical protein
MLKKSRVYVSALSVEFPTEFRRSTGFLGRDRFRKIEADFSYPIGQL